MAELMIVEEFELIRQIDQIIERNVDAVPVIDTDGEDSYCEEVNKSTLSQDILQLIKDRYHR